MKISKKGIDLIKQFEGCELRSYLCPAGVWTIGYGSTHGVTRGMVITPCEAEQLLIDDLSAPSSVVNGVRNKVELTQGQFDALVSFVYNLGSGAFRDSTLRRKLIARASKEEVAQEFDRWVFAKGRRLDGLVIRRAAEKELFLS